MVIPAVTGFGVWTYAGEENQSRDASSTSQSSVLQSSQSDKTKATPTEDMMADHAVFERILFIYQEAANRLFQNQTVPPEVLPHAGPLVRNFVDNVHIPLEEKYVFPRLEKAGQMEALVTHLRK